jgi:acetyl-CoA C-acetyltransferase
VKSAVIVAAKRTPVGALNGAISSLPGHQIGTIAIGAALNAAGLDPAMVEETILGQVLGAGSGMNPARQAARAAGIDDAAPAMTINQVCGSGLRAVALAAQQIQVASAQVLVAGGQESMSNAPHVAMLRKGTKLGDVAMVDTMMRDGLTDAFHGYPMGQTAENIVARYAISREAQDEFALASQQKASAAARTGRFVEEIAPVEIVGRKGTVTVDTDEYIRHDASIEALAGLKPAFSKDGSVTAGNSSGINDGAAALVLMDEDRARQDGMSPLVRIAGWGHAGLDPQLMGLGPIAASRKALERAGWSVDDVDLWEVNEAFAAQSIAVLADLHLDPDRVNVNGGAIAIGHPIGASGARVLVTLIHEMMKRDAHKGVATLCIGGGMGIALCVER